MPAKIRIGQGNKGHFTLANRSDGPAGPKTERQTGAGLRVGKAQATIGLMTTEAQRNVPLEWPEPAALAGAGVMIDFQHLQNLSSLWCDLALMINF